MSEDERLREALLELQLLRERETRTLQETQALLQCIEAFSAAPSPDAALRSVFTSLHTKIGADRTALLKAGADGTCRVVAADDPGWVGAPLVPPKDILDRPRNLADHALLGDWAGVPGLGDYKGTLIAPFPAPGGETYVLFCLRRHPHAFQKDDLNLVTRLAGLAVQALLSGEIAAENTLLAATIQGSSSGFAIADATQDERPLVYVNPAFEALSGYGAEEVLGTNCRFLTAEPEDAPERRRLRETVKANGSGRFLLRNRRKSGELFWNDLTLFPVRDGSGAVRNLVATQNDVTERIEAERERDRTRIRMEQSLAETDEAFVILESDMTVTFANGALRRTFPAGPVGWAPGTGFDANWSAFLANAEDMPGRITRLLATPDLPGLKALPAGREIDLPDGRSILVRASGLADGGLVVSASDVTPMKTAQVLLQQRLAAIEAAQDGIAISDDDGRLTYLNRAAAGLLGFASPGAGLGRKWIASYPGVEAPETPTDVEITLTREAGGGPRVHEITASPLDVRGSVILIRDVTERVETEAREEELKLALVRSQRQEAVAQLAAGIAHDFNNLLSAINGSAALISMGPEDPAQVATHADRITSAGARAARLVNRLLDLGAVAPARGTFDLRDALSDVPALVDASLPGGVTLDIDTQSGPLRLAGDPGDLNQVIVNLVFNARDAIGEGRGRITVEVGRADTDGSIAASVRVAARPRGLCAHYGDGYGRRHDRGDHGPGAGTLFHDEGAAGDRAWPRDGGHSGAKRGRRRGSSINPRAGTTVTVYWPLAGETGVASEPGQPAGTHDLSGMTIIVVDDEEDVGEVLQGYLEAFGAEVALCSDPRDALEAVEDDPGAWSAVITDYDMPGLSGGDLAEAIGRIAPDLPVFLATALARRLSDPRVAEGRVQGVFAKPLDLDQLCERLSEFRALE